MSVNPAEPVHFYDEADGVFTPTRLATGPWDRRLQNGVALAGLTAHLIERTPALAPMVTARFVIDIMKPTLMAPAAGRVIVVRDGKRLQLLRCEIEQDGVVAAQATALRVREGESPSTPVTSHGTPPEGLPTFNGSRSSFRHIVETRLESGGLEQLGPGVAWVRYDGEIVQGTRISPFVQIAMAADFGSGLSAFVDWREWSFANVDISLHLNRMPAGPWVRIASRTESAGNGIGIVHAALADLSGELGHAHQTLFLDRQNR